MKENYFVVGVKSPTDADYSLVGGTVYATTDDAVKDAAAFEKAIKSVGATVETKIFHLVVKGELE